MECHGNALKQTARTARTPHCLDGQFWMQLVVDGRGPKIIGISGPTKAGKTTLASGLARRICGGDRKLPPQFGRDRVERFLGDRGKEFNQLTMVAYYGSTIRSVSCLS